MIMVIQIHKMSQVFQNINELFVGQFLKNLNKLSEFPIYIMARKIYIL